MEVQYIAAQYFNGNQKLGLGWLSRLFCSKGKVCFQKLEKIVRVISTRQISKKQIRRLFGMFSSTNICEETLMNIQKSRTEMEFV